MAAHFSLVIREEGCSVHARQMDEGTRRMERKKGGERELAPCLAGSVDHQWSYDSVGSESYDWFRTKSRETRSISASVFEF
jgi:hypothetical protein